MSAAQLLEAEADGVAYDARATVDAALKAAGRQADELTWLWQLATPLWFPDPPVFWRIELRTLASTNPELVRGVPASEIRRRLRVYVRAKQARHRELTAAVLERDPARVLAAVRENRHPVALVAGVSPAEVAGAFEGRAVTGHRLLLVAHVLRLGIEHPGLLSDARLAWPHD